MNTPQTQSSVGSTDCSALPASFAVLKQAIEDDAFDGAEIACFGEYAASWNTRENIVAIADSGGWWKMPAEDLKAIAEATPNTRDDRRRATGSAQPNGA